jgi:hypothetical protein
MLLRRSLLAAGILGLALISACTETSEGEPRAATTETTTSSSSPGTSGNGSGEELPFAGAPKVDDPLDTSRYEQDPCKSLTSTQTQPLNLPATGEPMENVALGNGCTWFNEETRGEAQIVFSVSKSKKGLSSEYQAEKDGKWAYFKELPAIEGYPAIIRAATDDRDMGHCTVVVGVADDMVFESILRLSQANVGQRDPCEVAVQIAELALQTIKAGA